MLLFNVKLTFLLNEGIYTPSNFKIKARRILFAKYILCLFDVQ